MEQIEVLDHERVIILKRPPGTGIQIDDDIRIYTQFGNSQTTYFLVVPKESHVKRIEAEKWKRQGV